MSSQILLPTTPVRDSPSQPHRGPTCGSKASGFPSLTQGSFSPHCGLRLCRQTCQGPQPPQSRHSASAFSPTGPHSIIRHLLPQQASTRVDPLPRIYLASAGPNATGQRNPAQLQDLARVCSLCLFGLNCLSSASSFHPLRAAPVPSMSSLSSSSQDGDRSA